MKFIKKSILFFLSRIPLLEVIIKKIYWNSNFLIDYKNNSRKKKIDIKQKDINVLIDTLDIINFNSSDVLVLHSSYGDIKSHFQIHEGPKEIIDILEKKIGPNGTLAIPTHPLYSTKPIDKSYMRHDDTESITTYDVKNTKAWTGAIANTFLSLNGVLRSAHPINSIAAKGKYAYEMICNNLMGEYPKANGVNSSWNFCVKHNAIILGLGVDLVHSLTIIHVAEDTDESRFPNDKWYYLRKFRILQNGNDTEIVVRERKHKWAIYYAERSLKRDLIKANILKEIDIDGFAIEYIQDSSLLMSYLKKRGGFYPYRGVRK